MDESWVSDVDMEDGMVITWRQGISVARTGDLCLRKKGKPFILKRLGLFFTVLSSVDLNVLEDSTLNMV
jgi:hypothetical protein